MADLASSLASFNNYNSDTSNNKFAFLVHSQDTLPNNLPPNVDDKPLARQKRRRTSPEDQSILEAEYKKNPKPNKAARMEIVSRVALGEKEVQIWFQNRRQNTRRKSRPLLPNEVLPSPRLSSSAETLDGATCVSTDEGQNGSFGSAYSSQESIVVSATGAVGGENNRVIRAGGSSQSDATGITQPFHGCDLKLKVGVNNKDQDGNGNAPSLRPNGCFDSRGIITDDGPAVTAPKDTQNTRTLKPSQEHTYPLNAGLGYISNRRNILSGNLSLVNATRSTIPSSSQDLVHYAHTREGNKPAPLLKRISSLVRLSLSLDGKAEVVMSEEESPPLPQSVVTWKAPALRAGGLQRSKSAIDIIERPGRHLSGGALPGSAIGRSRDARTWEFYCDSEARSALSTQENSGSASEAINLLRSRKNPLLPSMNKRNAQLGMQEPSKRLKATSGLAQKQKLVRTTSSVARLQTTNKNETKEPATSKVNKKPRLGIPSIPDNPGDSDKENWVPGTKKAAEQHHPENRSVKPVLGENNSILSHATSFGVTMDREKFRQRDIARPYSIPGLDVDTKEPKKMLRESRSGSSVSGEEELDCVQNLLSLRKGCWR